MNTTKKHFIFGYGSLINSASRAVTGKTGNAIPARVKGYQRHWSVMSPEFGMSSVAVVAKEGHHCNGVLVEVPESELPSFDQREKGYKRSRVSVQHLSAYGDDNLPDGDIWIYHTEEIVDPHHHCPIALSYADVILAGCIEHGEEFAQDFLELTNGWQHPLLNDRQKPRYPRVQPTLKSQAFELNRLFASVDQVTQQHLQENYQ